MPAFYAHFRFGKKASESLTGPIKEITAKYSTQFEIGLQGPDVFFFYKPYTTNRIVKYGHHLHEILAYPFFEHGMKVIEDYGRDSKEYAYLLGVICHFALDGACHPYIGEMIESTGVKHLEIEEEFEKALLRLDEEDPVGFDYGSLVPTDLETCQAIAPFYEDVTETIAKISLTDLKRVKKLLTAPGKVKQGAINTAMKMTGKHAYLKGLMNQRKDNLKCRVTNAGLIERFDGAVSLAVEMMESFDESLVDGTVLNRCFDRNFL